MLCGAESCLLSTIRFRLGNSISIRNCESFRHAMSHRGFRGAFANLSRPAFGLSQKHVSLHVAHFSPLRFLNLLSNIYIYIYIYNMYVYNMCIQYLYLYIYMLQVSGMIWYSMMLPKRPQVFTSAWIAFLIFPTCFDKTCSIRLQHPRRS